MWLFDPRLLSLRKTHYFIVKIDSHPDADVSGRREGKVFPEPEFRARYLPLLETVSLDVKVEYSKQAGTEIITDLMSVTNLSPAQLRLGARAAIIRGDRVGNIVIYQKPFGEVAKVYVEGTNSRTQGFRVKKKDLCLVEPKFI